MKTPDQSEPPDLCGVPSVPSHRAGRSYHPFCCGQQWRQAVGIKLDPDPTFLGSNWD